MSRTYRAIFNLKPKYHKVQEATGSCRRYRDLATVPQLVNPDDAPLDSPAPTVKVCSRAGEGHCLVWSVGKSLEK